MIFCFSAHISALRVGFSESNVTSLQVTIVAKSSKRQINPINSLIFPPTCLKVISITLLFNRIIEPLLVKDYKIQGFILRRIDSFKVYVKLKEFFASLL
jgi:hypothetical protein